MKINLDYPYNTLWKNGYIVVNPEGRRNVILFNTQSDRSTVSYARYLMSIKLGRFLTDQEEVDHKDDNKTNDDIDNLQILNPRDNKAKENSKRILYYEFTCPSCGKLFSLTGKELGKRRNKLSPSCSKICGYKKNNS